MLFCITANYTPKALEAMAKNTNTNRLEAVDVANNDGPNLGGGGGWG